MYDDARRTHSFNPLSGKPPLKPPWRRRSSAASSFQSPIGETPSETLCPGVKVKAKGLTRFNPLSGKPPLKLNTDVIKLKRKLAFQSPIGETPSETVPAPRQHPAAPGFNPLSGKPPLKPLRHRRGFRPRAGFNPLSGKPPLKPIRT